MIEIKNLNYKYKTGNFNISDINLKIEDNEFVCIIGKNGSGKSTFTKILAGLTKFKNGNIFINNIDLSNKKNFLEIRKNIGIVFQNPENQILFDKVYDDIAFSLKNLGVPYSEFDFRIDEALKKVNMLEYKNSSTQELSLGQKQKIAIASSLAINPNFLILDEPTTMLDPMSKNSIYEVLKSLKSSGITIIFVTNFIDEILLADKIIVFDNGKITNCFKKEDLFLKLQNLKDFEVPGIISIISKLHENGVSIDLKDFSIDTLIKQLLKI